MSTDDNDKPLGEGGKSMGLVSLSGVFQIPPLNSLGMPLSLK